MTVAQTWARDVIVGDMAAAVKKFNANCPELESHVLRILIFNITWNGHEIKINAVLIPRCLVPLVACTPHNAIMFDCRLNRIYA